MSEAKINPAGSETFLYEDVVVEAVMNHLKQHGWSIESFAMAHQHGDDIVAVRGSERLVVEAKGAGSSKPTTARYGESFNHGQVRSHISVAVYRALRIWSEGNSRLGLAFPDNRDHRQLVSSISPALHELGIVIFWVSSNHTVSVDPADWAGRSQ